MTLRVDDNEVARDIKRGVDKADTRTSGRDAGNRWSAGFREGMRGLSGAGSGLTALTSDVMGLSDATKLASGNSSILVKAIGGLGLATGLAEPAVSALGVAVGALGAGVVAGGLGLGAYGAALLPIMGRVQELTKIQFAAADGAKLTNTQLAQLAQLMKTTPRPILDFANALTGARTAWHDWAFSLAQPVLAPLTDGLKLVNPLLHDMTPFVKEAAGALDILVGKMRDAVQSTGFKDWLATMLPLVKPTIVGLGTAVGNIVGGLGDILKAFAPFSKGLIDGIVKITQKFQDWASTLDQHSGFKAMVSQWRTTWPEVKKGLELMLQILLNIVSAMAGMSTPANSRALWLALNPILAVTEALSSHPVLVQLIVYMLALAKGAGAIKGIFDSLKSGWEGVNKFLGLVSGGKISAGMQGSGDTMLLAAKNMQAAADTMLTAAGGEQRAAGAQEAAAGEAAAGGAVGRGGRLAGIAGRAGVAGAVAVAADLIARAIVKLVPKQGGLGQREAKAQVDQLGPVSRTAHGIAVTLFGPGIDNVAAWWATHVQDPIRESAKATWGAIQRSAVSAWQNLYNSANRNLHQVASAFDRTRHDIAAVFGGGGRWLVAAGRAIINGLRSGITTAWQNTRAWLEGTASRVTTAVGTLVSTLTSRGRNLITGMYRGVTGFWSGTVSPWLHGVGARAQGLVGGLVSTLTSRGRSLISGLHNGVTGVWNGTVGPWLRGVGGRAAAAVGNLARTLFGAGQTVINGLHSGMNSAWQGALGFLRSIPGAIMGVFSGAGGWLVSAGSNVIAGLWQGMINMWSRASSWISGLGGWIASHKGPRSADLILLRDNGLAIMQGLLTGLQSGFASGPGPYLQQVAGWVSNAWQTIVGGSTAMAAQVGRKAASLAGSVLSKGSGILGDVRNVISQINAGGTFSWGGFSATVPAGLLGGLSFDRGGMLGENVVGLGARSGRRYTFHAGEQVQPDPDATNRLLSMLIAAVQENAGQTGNALAAALDTTARKSTYRASYAVR